MNFDNQIPEWKNSGSEPSENLKNKGFEGGYKPPAGIFNWFWSLVSKAITELQNKLSSHTHGIETGGTGATVRKDALKNLAYLGDEPISGTDKDTVANWVALGTGFAYYSAASQLIGQPTAHGTVINITNGKGDLTQIWQNRPTAIVYVRGGNSQGWFDEGNWSKLALDSDLVAHKSRTDNPHAVTKAQVGLGNVDNTADKDKYVKNASLFKNHEMRAEDCFLYVNYNKVTVQTTDEWYLRIRLDRKYCNASTPVRLCADYDNCKCSLYLTLEGIGDKWSARVTDYNSMNILGFRVKTGIKADDGEVTTYIYLKLRAPAGGTGNCELHTDYSILEMATYDGSGETFENIGIGFYTNLPINTTYNGGVKTIAEGGTGANTAETALKNLFAGGNAVLSGYQYGDELPAAGTEGRIFFKKV